MKATGCGVVESAFPLRAWAAKLAKDGVRVAHQRARFTAEAHLAEKISDRVLRKSYRWLGVMTSFSQIDRENLQAALGSVKGSLFTGVLVGAGSVILHFSDRSSETVLCPFEVFDGEVSNTGHGESPATSLALFGFLDERIGDASVDEIGQITLIFGTDRGIRMIPDKSGFESYVFGTPDGVFPVW